jgi:hypothetical protein
MKFHTCLGTTMRLTKKELDRQFNGLTIAVRPSRRKLVEGKHYAYVVSLAHTSGLVKEQILAEDKYEVTAACRHLMRWLDKSSADHIKAADRSRDRYTRKGP